MLYFRNVSCRYSEQEKLFIKKGTKGLHDVEDIDRYNYLKTIK